MKLYLTTRLGNLTHEFVPVEYEQKAVYDARIEIVTWLLNEGELRDEKEIKNYISNLEEELLAYQFANDTSYLVKVAEAKLVELRLFCNEFNI